LTFRIGIGFNTDIPVSQTLHYTLLAEEMGFDSFWLHEHSFSRDALSYLAAASLATTKIKLGVGCVSAYTRHPIVLAMSFLTLQEASSGRVIMGLGTGFPMRLDLLGIKHEKPIAALRETIEICRGIWGGKQVTLKGSIYSVTNVKSLAGTAQSTIPIYIAAWKDQMLALTGKLADGYIAKGGESTKSLKRIVLGIERSAARNGRRLSEIDISAYLLTQVSRTDEEAYLIARKDPFVCYMLSVQDDYLYEETGIDPSLKKPIAENYFRGNISEAQSHITNEMLSSFVVAGTPDSVCDKVKEFEKCGLNLAILQPITKNPEDIKSVIRVGAMLRG
jgi:5,10-methylenetetrahydromethanopterin reductase